MDFLKNFVLFLHENELIKKGNFILSSGKKSNAYIDLRALPSYPNQFYRLISHIRDIIIKNIGMDKFDCFIGIPTSGLIIASALSFKSMKPLIYVRNKKKEHGTQKYVEGILKKNMNGIIIDDVITTGKSIKNTINILQKENINVKDVLVVVNRSKNINFINDNNDKNIRLHQVVGVKEITKYLKIKL